MKTCVMLVALMAAVGATAQSTAPDPAAQRAALVAVEEEFGKASAERGLEGWLSFHDPSAVIFPPGNPIVVGMPAIREYYAKTGFSPEGLTWKAIFSDVSASGDLGYTYGYWTFTGADSQGKPVTRDGKYLTIWKRQADGTWKLVADIGNAAPPKS